MIITKEFAEKLDKKTLAELATKYCNEFAEKLGSDEKVEINPGEVICKKDEAEHIFTDRHLKKIVQKEQAFVHNATAYTPLVNPSFQEQVLIFRVAGYDSRKYASLRGFGAEMGHITAKKIYGKDDVGLEEAVDYASQFHEVSVGVRMVCESEGISTNDGIEKILACEEISWARKMLEAYESLLFDGEDAALGKLSKICQSEAKNMLEEIKLDYITTAHFNGLKLFISAYDNENCNLNRTYRRIGELMSNPKINNALDALRRLYHPKLDTTFGYLKWLLFPDRKLSKYEDVFSCDTVNRVLRLEKNKYL